MLLVALVLHPFLAAQKTYSLSGQVIDEGHHSLPGAVVVLNNGKYNAVTDRDGKFLFINLSEGIYILEVSHIGFHSRVDSVQLSSNRFIEAELLTQRQSLQEVIVSDHHADLLKKEDSRSIEVLNEEYLKRNIAGSLMTSLERIPGVSAITIGSGQSKPVIRGLGFNRVVVTENGIKHEGQQWGVDHGLEIDQYAAERIEIIKGPSSLMYGSDAIGGLINVNQYRSPAPNSLGGSLELTTKTNNKSLGGSFSFFTRKEKLFLTLRLTGVSYADYRVPTNEAQIYNWDVPLHNNQVRNTAGNEHNFHLSTGFIGSRFTSRFYYSFIDLKSGFFANAAGLEPLDADIKMHDHADRDILMPYQDVAHHKLTNHSVLHFNDNKLEFDLGIQNNFRREWTKYSPHGSMPVEFPGTMPFPETLEKAFDLDIYSGNIRHTINSDDRLSIILGLNSEYHENRIDGRGFLIPEYDRFAAGGFFLSRINLSEHSLINAGLRYDMGQVKTYEYFDWYTTPVVDNSGDTNDVYLQRAWSLSRIFNNLSWSVGYNFNHDEIQAKFNLGKSFRVPHAKELAANGLNTHMFRVEKGDSSLKAEEAYQLDIGLEWFREKFALGISPFANYFTNYIYLNPTAIFDNDLNKQVYEYDEAEVMRLGGEVHAHYSITSMVKTGVIIEYVHSRQLSGIKKGYTLPFSPPPSVLLNLSFTGNDHSILHAPFISIDYNIVLEQTDIVPPEETTPGYQVINLSAGFKFFTGKNHIDVNAQFQNLLNTRYYNHSSYYRLINMPEPGFNFILNVSVSFKTTKS
jgi:iron complex outermembrane receptor protein